jgi:hypothetical protein
MSEISPDETRAFIAKMDAALLPMFTKCVLPLYGEQNGVAVQCGTGTLFRIAGISFLVTASHVADIMAKHHIQLFVSDGVQGAREIALEGKLHSERVLDIAVWELPHDIVQQLPNRTFLTVQHADRANKRITTGWYHIHGYPNCWSQSIPAEQRTIVKQFTYGTVLYDGDTSGFADYNPEVHVLLTAPKDGNIDSHGAETEMPNSLKGISGCSMWQSYYEGLPSKSWTVDDATVIAVETATFRDGTVVQGTRWWVVNEIIRQNYPELAGPLSLITPYKRGTNKNA